MSIRARLEFLDGQVFDVELPPWHEGAEGIISAKPGTMEDVTLFLVRTTKDGVRIYRERPPAKVIPFPMDRVKKKTNG